MQVNVERILFFIVIYVDYVCFLFLWHLLFISKFTLICFYESLTNVDVIHSSDLC